jgi:hypothetical protein
MQPFCVLKQPPLAFNAPFLRDNKMVVSWSGVGVLQQASKVQGPYTNAINQTKPQEVPVDEPSKFLRLRR